jgi:ubiquinone/menaquinone biosynthesis C-methylase UbiE
MDHRDHVNLLKPANIRPGGTWADFGAGAGAFTLALRELVGSEAKIYAIDKDKTALKDLEEEFRAMFQSVQNLALIPLDFSGPLDLPPLDGLVMANSLHYFKHKEKILRHVSDFLKPQGTLLLVEYNVDAGNPWVPYPLSFETYRVLAPQAGLTEPSLLAKAPSRFLREFYSAAANKQEEQL